jgi:hypothetical protein
MAVDRLDASLADMAAATEICHVPLDVDRRPSQSITGRD